eukprot:CAMPEP_0202788436 /NCGR_PEP_ID=MMETSP1388-20130828/74780_1 /ASSEMBLY_ACC=CAM_ASM_000864 /TAXON_ID=37098 /ORGANISM="Isochrysis sp, Strain CCMP1244" /LENGTH=116 /DNA_ID=CAMNT_0049458087 /DNA_START=27 /DNA_END=374 /DNA_ORIENTATION=+
MTRVWNICAVAAAKLASAVHRVGRGGRLDVAVALEEVVGVVLRLDLAQAQLVRRPHLLHQPALVGVHVALERVRRLRAAERLHLLLHALHPRLRLGAVRTVGVGLPRANDHDLHRA